MKDMNFGPILEACRERASLTQEDMAERLGMARSSISKLENNKRTLNMNTAYQWCKETGSQEVMVAFLWGIDGLTILQNLLQSTAGIINVAFLLHHVV